MLEIVQAFSNWRKIPHKSYCEGAPTSSTLDVHELNSTLN